MTAVLRTSSLAFMDRIFYPDSQINKGEVVFLLGPSGSGKSTLLRLLNGTVSPSGGWVFYNGRDILEYNPLQIRREVILASQSAYLFPGSVRENFHQYHEFRESPLPDDESIKNALRSPGAFLPAIPATTFQGEKSSGFSWRWR